MQRECWDCGYHGPEAEFLHRLGMRCPNCRRIRPEDMFWEYPRERRDIDPTTVPGWQELHDRLNDPEDKKRRYERYRRWLEKH